MAAPKKFDAVTIIGLALAMAIIFYGMRQSQQKAELERQRLEAIALEEAHRPMTPPVRIGTNGVPTPTPNGETPRTPEAPEADKPVAETPDIVVTGEFLQFTLASKGATIKSAMLPGGDEDPALKDKKGLVILTEIETGKRAFGIPKFLFKSDSAPDASVDLDGTVNSTLDQRVWEVKDSGSFDAAGVRTIAYSLTVKKITVTKTYAFKKTDRFLKCSVVVENKSGQDGTLFYYLNGPQGIMPDIPPIDPQLGPQQIAIQTEIAGRDSVASGQLANDPDVIQIYATSITDPDEKNRSVSRQENLWGAVKNRFHMAILISLEPRQVIKLLGSKIQNEMQPEDKRLAELNIGLTAYRSTVKLPNNGAQSDPYALYLGPSDDQYVDEAEKELKLASQYHLRHAIQFCDIFSWRWPRVDWLARQLMWVFQGLHKIFGNFGVALLLTTMLIKLLLHPLQRRMMVHMSKMQKLQPEIEKIKAKYKGKTSMETQQKMQVEIRDLTLKEGANPVAGCLPMLIQIPVLSALYGIFSHAFDMRGAEFLWIKDLSQPDHLARLPMWPHWLNALPLLYIVLSYIQTKMATSGQPKSDDPQQEMQKKMMMFMPVLIGVMWYSMMPAGLMLYFVVSAMWAAAESWYIKKFVLHDPNAPVPASAGI